MDGEDTESKEETFCLLYLRTLRSGNPPPRSLMYRVVYLLWDLLIIFSYDVVRMLFIKSIYNNTKNFKKRVSTYGYSVDLN